MFVLSTVVFAISLISFSDASYYFDNLQKCSVNDDECLRSLFQNIFQVKSACGVPELGIPSLQPLVVKNVSIPILNIVTGTLVSGGLSGIESCVYTKFKIDLENQVTVQELTCDALEIEGDVKLSGANSAIESVLGFFSLESQGNGKIKLDQLQLKFEAPIGIFKKDDGKAYMKLQENLKYSYEIGDAKIFAEGFYIGNHDISKIGETYLNENWKPILSNFGSILLESAVDIYLNVANSFFPAIPLEKFVIENVSPYVENVCYNNKN